MRSVDLGTFVLNRVRYLLFYKSEDTFSLRLNYPQDLGQLQNSALSQQLPSHGIIKTYQCNTNMKLQHKPDLETS